MKTATLFCLHPSAKDVESTFKLMHLKNTFGIDFEWSSTHPDYLIVSEHIYINKHINKKFRELYPYAKVVIFYTGEAMSPDFNLFDYAVGFDGELKNGDRFSQICPPFMMFKGFLYESENEITSEKQALHLLKEKTGFCNFLYSNWMAHPRRDELFYALSSYKRVDSLGKHLNNVGVKGTGFRGHALDCIKLKNSYKFSIACENASFVGYTSEKILTSLAAHTVPVYWGDSEIAKNINPDCFINCNELNSMGEVIERVREIDENDALWAKMVSSPWRTEEQIAYHEERYSRYVAFFERIFTQPVEKVRRIPSGTFPQWNRDFFFHSPIVHHGLFYFQKKKFAMRKHDKANRKKFLGE